MTTLLEGFPQEWQKVKSGDYSLTVKDVIAWDNICVTTAIFVLGTVIYFLLSFTNTSLVWLMCSVLQLTIIGVPILKTAAPDWVVTLKPRGDFEPQIRAFVQPNLPYIATTAKYTNHVLSWSNATHSLIAFAVLTATAIVANVLGDIDACLVLWVMLFCQHPLRTYLAKQKQSATPKMQKAE